MTRQPILIVAPAYGRHYTSPEAALADWLAGRDFKIPRGPYLSIRDCRHLREAGYTGVRIMPRYPTGLSFAYFPIPKEECNAIPQD